MKKLIYLVIAVCLALLAACKKEAALVASTNTLGYTVPQGNHPYDKTILDFYNKYNVYLLYKFTDKDTYWTPLGYKNATIDATGVGLAGYQATPADTTNDAYITNQLVALNRLWFRFYTDKFLNQFLPVKIMLCSSVDSVYAAYVFTPTYHATRGDVVVGAWFNYDNMCVNYGNSSVLNMALSDSLKFAKKVNLVFAQSMVTRNLTGPTADFTAISSYATTNSNQATAYAGGIISTYSSSPTPTSDWSLFIQAMVSCTEATLNKSQSNTTVSLVGILNPTKDTNGKIRQRYNIVRNYFINTYGVDLQAIGNYTGR